MSKTTLVVAGAVASSLLLAWILLGGEGNRGRDERPGPPARDPDPVNAAAEPLRPAQVEPVGTAPGAGAPERVEPEPPAPVVTAASGPFRLRFVRADGGAPCPGARVWWLPASEVAPGWSQPQALELFQRNARVVTADGSGVLGLDLPKAGTVRLLAEWEGLSAFLAVKLAQDETTEVELAPSFDLEVLVRTDAGAPLAGIRVRFGPRDPYRGNHSEVPTDAEGRVVFRRAGEALAREPDEPFAVVVTGVFLDPTQVVLERASLPGPPIVLVLPATGSIVADVRDPAGEPLAGRAEAQLQLIPPGKPRDLSPFRNEPYPNASAVLEAGRATFPSVPVGHEFGLRVTRPGQQNATAEFFQGPSRAGEEVRVQLVHGLGAPILVFPLQDGAGAPLPNQAVKLTTQVQTSFMVDRSDSTAHSDAAGLLEVQLPTEVDPADRRRLVFETELAGVKRRASFEVTATYPPGRQVQEPLVFGEPPLLVAGTVVDSAGAPVVGARLLVESGLDRYNRSTEKTDARSGADGTFRIDRIPMGDLLFVRAETDDARSPRVEVAPGRADLVLAVEGVGGLLGNVLVDDPDFWSELRVYALAAGAEKGEAAPREQVPEEGSFRLRELFPGTYDVKLELDNQVVLTVEGLHVSPGDPRPDPRLRDLDLRGRLHAHRLTFLKDGEPVAVQGTLIHRPAGKAEPQRWKWFRDNPFTLLTAEPAVDVTANLNGYRAQVLPNLRGDRELELQDAIPVRLVLRSDVKLPDPPLYLKATLAPVSDPMLTDWGASTFDEKNESTCRALATGALQIRWILEKRSGQGAMARSVDIEGETVEVLDSSAEQVFEITLSQADVDRVLAEQD